MKRMTYMKQFLFVLLAGFVLFGCATAKKELSYSGAPAAIYTQAMAAYGDAHYGEAEVLFKRLMEQHPLSPYSVEAQLMLGDVCYMGQRYEEAASYYTSFIAMHPGHPKASYAFFQKGMSHFKGVLTIDRDQTSTRKALFAFQDLLKNYPGCEYAEKADEIVDFLRKRLAEREFYVGKFYLKGDNYKGALARFRDILQKYPDCGLTDQALYYIGVAYSELGERTLAREAFSGLMSDYPESPYAEDAEDMVQ